MDRGPTLTYRDLRKEFDTRHETALSRHSERMYVSAREWFMLARESLDDIIKMVEQQIKDEDNR